MGIISDERRSMRGGGGGPQSSNLGLLPTLFMEQIILEQRQDDQRETTQMGLCFLFGRESMTSFSLFKSLNSSHCAALEQETGSWASLKWGESDESELPELA